MKKFSEIPKEIFKEMEQIGEDIFGTHHDDAQIPITEESRQRLHKLTPYWLHYEVSPENHPISWVVIIPTQKNLAEKFLKGDITENEMFQQTIPQEKYDAAYLCAAITVPKYRGQGLAGKLFQEILEYIPMTDDAILFTWLSTEDGKGAFDSSQKKIKREILTRG